MSSRLHIAPESRAEAPARLEGCVVFLSSQGQLHREARYYCDAFRRRLNVVCLETKADGQYESLDALLPANGPVRLIIVAGNSGWLPLDLTESVWPTATFHCDTFIGTPDLLRWAMLFDYPCVFHPGFDTLYRRHGHPSPLLLGHAVEERLYGATPRERRYDVGWVGRLDGRQYAERAALVNRLAKEFRMNDVRRHYSAEEQAALYEQSHMVVNVSRSDYPQDANLRCFEAMAAGALLLTSRGSELQHLGFEEGHDYVEYDGEESLLRTVRHYRDHLEECATIASRGRTKTLSLHTYDRRVDYILAELEKRTSERPAPARKWRKEEVVAVALHHAARHRFVDVALSRLTVLRRLSLGRALLSLPWIFRAFAKSILLSLRTS